MFSSHRKVILSQGSQKKQHSLVKYLCFCSQSLVLPKFLARLILFGSTAHLQQLFHNSYFFHFMILDIESHEKLHFVFFGNTI